MMEMSFRSYSRMLGCTLVFALIGLVPFQTAQGQSNLCEKDSSEAYTYLLSGQWSKAKQALDSVVLRCESPKFYFDRGFCSVMLNDDSSALRDFDQESVQTSYEADTTYWLLKGYTQVALKKWTDSYTSLQKAKQLGVSDTFPFLSLIGSTYYFTDRTDEALEYLESKSDIFPTQQMWANIGWIHLDSQEYELAHRAFQEAMKSYEKEKGSSADQAHCLGNLGYTTTLVDNRESGIKMMQEALKLDSTNAYIHRNLGMLSLMVGDTLSACESLRNSIELGIQNEHGEHYVEQLLEACPIPEIEIPFFDGCRKSERTASQDTTVVHDLFEITCGGHWNFDSHMPQGVDISSTNFPDSAYRTLMLSIYPGQNASYYMKKNPIIDYHRFEEGEIDGRQALVFTRNDLQPSDDGTVYWRSEIKIRGATGDVYHLVFGVRQSADHEPDWCEFQAVVSSLRIKD